MRKVNEEVWAERREVLRRFSESGVSAAEFCRREGIPYGRLMAWQKRIRTMDEGPILAGGGSAEVQLKPTFAELVVRESAKEKSARSSGAPVEIVLPGGALVRVYTGADAAVLRAVFEAARAC